MPKSNAATAIVLKLLPVIGPFVVILAAIGVFRLVNKAPLRADFLQVPKAVTASHLAAEWQARLIWEASVVVLIVVGLATIFYALHRVQHYAQGQTRRGIYVGIGGLSAVAIFLTTRNDVALKYTREALLEPTIGALGKLSGAGGYFSLAEFELFRMTTNGLTGVASVFLVFAIAACTTLASRPQATADDDWQAAGRIARQMRELSGLIYMGTALLISVVLSMLAWLHWPAALVTDPASQQQIKQVALGLGFFWGTAFTLMLIAAYLPAALYLRSQAYLSAERYLAAQQGGGAEGDDTPPPTVDAWIASRGLNISLRAHFTRLAALLGPLAAGGLPLVNELLGGIAS